MPGMRYQEWPLDKLVIAAILVRTVNSSEDQMEEFSGVVFKVWEKPVGGRTLYSFNFDGEKTYYGMGDDRKSGVIESGYNVTVRVEKNDKG